jgi:hypothetical protein
MALALLALEFVPLQPVPVKTLVVVVGVLVDSVNNLKNY